MTAAADLGAGLQGVKDLLPTLALDGSSKPTADAAGRLLEATSADVSTRVGERLRRLAAAAVDLPDLADDVANVRTFAAHLAEVGAAALVADAAWPERADTDQTDTAIAAGLRSQFAAGMTALDSALDRLLEDNPTSDADPAICSPPPVFSTRTVW